ncbi:DUF3027 domain-containing protein [Desulfosporosinus youngiae]|uniref:Uncharacterized protein n=1 Tax=Desulfosporosinus youngiae DSM 17734 TaxID=768710 RepID=H5XX90_9FIRM|nr:DUF3027 domain-containing protein [Desulfosporosinus youngiae]EHQ91030.1 Protein of unknown function (DUF3027) [Desulfosporosinus youngiae DSM 17734]
MNAKFEEIRKNITGLDHCYIRVGYGGKLRLGLGNKIYYKHPRLQGKFYGEWDISSLSCSWRIADGKKLLCGYDDEVKFCNEVIESLHFGRISEVIQLSFFDIRLVFNSGKIIDYFLQSKEDVSLVISGEKEKVTYELFSDGWEKTSSKESSSKLTRIEEVLSSLSENCHNRWNRVVNHVESDLQCNTCFYFRGLDGHFYFWDYGICSNEDSMFDGKLVSINSSCTCHKELKDIF